MRPQLRSVWRYRPRVLTLLLVASISALLVLANLSGEAGTRRVAAGSLPADKVGKIAFGNASNTNLNLTIDFDLREPDAEERSAGYSLGCISYGWPMLWRQYLIVSGYGSYVVGETYSGVRLAIDSAIWLVLLAAPAALCEWLLRRYRPRLRFSLRTLLTATALGASLCGWYAAVRNRANIQDPLIAAMGPQWGWVWGERWGPKWLEVVGADRYCRRIVGIQLHCNYGEDDDEAGNQGKRLLAALKQLHDLRFLDFEAERLTPEIAASFNDLRRLETLWLDVDETTGSSGRSLAAALGGMRNLHVLSLDFGFPGLDANDATASHELLAAIGAMPQLEYLRLDSCVIAREDLALLATLTNLKSLTLNRVRSASDEFPSDPLLLARLPALPYLETLDLNDSDVYDADLPYIAALPRLKSLDLSDTKVSGAGWVDLARLESLETLDLEDSDVNDAGLPYIAALPRLKSLDLSGTRVSGDGLGELARLESLKTLAFDEILRAPEALRKANPELVIVDGWRLGLQRPSVSMAPKCDRIPHDGGVWMAQAVRRWHEQQAGKSPPAGAGNPSAPQKTSGR